ncbi:MAG TPA: aldose 1-epimerase family protein [Clostridiales bacterium]|nr:aldose 1-epimerase family protein [Clostridiales bacterium]
MNYTLENEYLQLRFRSIGGEITSIQSKDGLEYLWQGDPAYWSGQAPVLFPICGSLRNNTASIGNKGTCHMPRHGIARKREFQLDSITSNSITFSLHSDDISKESYPYDFLLRITYTLDKNSVTTSYHIQNDSGTPMPFFIGGHPAFHCPLSPKESFEDYVIEFEHEENASCPSPDMATGLIDSSIRTRYLENERILPLKHDLFYRDSLVFDELKSRQVRLKSLKSEHGIELAFPDFDYFVLWSSYNDGPFVALEPWTGLSTCSDEDDIFEHKRGVRILNSQEEATLQYKITAF